MAGPQKHPHHIVRAYVQSCKGQRAVVIEDEKSAIIQRAAANGVRQSDGVTAYGADSAYPQHGGGWVVSDRVNDFADSRVAAAKHQKAEAQAQAQTQQKAAAAQASQEQTKADAARQQTQTINDNLRAEHAKKQQIEERYQASEKFATEWEADKARKAKAEALKRLAAAPKISGKAMNQFDPTVIAFADELRRIVQEYPNDKKIAAFAQETHKTFMGLFSAFERGFQQAIKGAKEIQKQGTAAALSSSSGGIDVDDLVNEMMRAIHNGQTFAQSGRGDVAAGDYSAAYSDAFLAHQQMVNAANQEQRYAAAVQRGATRIVDMLHEIETDCESVMNFVDAAVTGGKFAAVFPTIVDSVEAGVSEYMGQEHKTLQELGMGLAINLIFHLLDRHMKDPVTEELKTMLEVEVRKLSRGVVKQIIWTDVYTAAAQSLKTSLNALATAYFEQVKDPSKPLNWKTVASEIYAKWQQDFITDQASIIAGLKPAK